MGLFGKKKVATVEKKAEVKQASKKVPVKSRMERDNRKEYTIPEIYDDLYSHKQMGDMITDNGEELDSERMKLEYGQMKTKTGILKYYMVEGFPTYMRKSVLKKIKYMALKDSVDTKMQILTYIEPYSINWDTDKMRRRMRSWERKTQTTDLDKNNAFRARENKAEIDKMEQMEESFRYYEMAEMEYNRSLCEVSMYFILIGSRDNIVDLEKAIKNLKNICSNEGFRITEAKADVFQWNKVRLPMSLRDLPKIKARISKRVMTDDIVANMYGIGQGRIGMRGIPFGEDVYSGLVVLKKLREIKDDAENILITAQTGGGKSVFVKNIIINSLKDMTVTVLDYEGDEYTNLVTYINNGREGDAIRIDMSAGNNRYFEPLRIAEPTGDPLIDKDAMKDSQQYTMAIFKVLAGDPKTGLLSLQEEDIISDCIKNLYTKNTIYEDMPETWANSKNLRISMIFDELKENIQTRQWIDVDNDKKQLIAEDLRDKLKRYFEPGQVEYGMFGEPLDIEDIRDARFIVFSFGQKGKSNVGTDDKQLAIKQLCVSNISAQISNYCKYVKKQFNIKVWEEFQRWIKIKGSGEVILNEITGGRKRGSINFILTNNLTDFLKEGDAIMDVLRQNMTGYCVGLIKDKSTREKFCKEFGLMDLLPDLDRIFKQNKKGANGQFNKAFVIKFDGTKKSPELISIVKAIIHPSIIEGGIFGDVMKGNDDEEEKE